ncbi:hypothetical protein SUDANB70_03613 [Streptomyces sp. enrichment culture]
MMVIYLALGMNASDHPDGRMPTPPFRRDIRPSAGPSAFLVGSTLQLLVEPTLPVVP